MRKSIYTILTVAFASLSGVNAQVAIGTQTPQSSAILQLESTEKGFLPPRMTSAQRDAISNPVEGLTIFNISSKCVQWYEGPHWFDACIVAADVPRVVGANGRIWMDRNLGAGQAATASNNSASYGDLYQWGRAADGHQVRSSTTTTTLSSSDTPGGDFILTAGDWRSPQNNNLWQGVRGINNPCPTGYYIPTEAEWNAERLSWTSNNSIGALASPLKLPLAGQRFNQINTIFGTGTSGFYWSSTVSGVSAKALIFSSSEAKTEDSTRAFGNSVRCIKN
jgi:uncharacterized protein (TIGR02145 family)